MDFSLLQRETKVTLEQQFRADIMSKGKIVLKRSKLCTMRYFIFNKKLFFEGSFKYYQKVALILDLPLNLEPIDIEVWVKNCNNDENF